MSYVNLVPREHGGLAEVLERSVAVGGVAWSDFRDVNVAYVVGRGIEYRLQATQVDEALYVRCAAAMDVGDELLTTVDTLHEELIVRFERTITERARELWELQR